MSTIKKILETHLQQAGFDGLCHPETECGCGLGDFMPCDNPSSECAPAYLIQDPNGDDFYTNHFTNRSTSEEVKKYFSSFSAD